MVTAESILFTATSSLFVNPSVPASRCPAFADTRPTQFRSVFAGPSQQRRCQSTRSWTSEPTREDCAPCVREEPAGDNSGVLSVEAALHLRWAAAPGADAGGL